VSFPELALVLVVGLLVLGPERLPRVAGRIFRFAGRARRRVEELRREIERQILAADAAVTAAAKDATEAGVTASAKEATVTAPSRREGAAGEPGRPPTGRSSPQAVDADLAAESPQHPREHGHRRTSTEMPAPESGVDSP